VDEHLPSHACDTELVDVRRPERVDVATLEPLQRLGFLDDADPEAGPRQKTVDRVRASPNASPREEGVDAESTPSGINSPQREDVVGEVNVEPSGTTTGTAGLIPNPFNAFFSVVSAPEAPSPLRDPEYLADLAGSNTLLEMPLDGLQSKSNVLLDQSHPSRGPYVLSVQGTSCPVNAHLGSKGSSSSLPERIELKPRPFC